MAEREVARKPIFFAHLEQRASQPTMRSLLRSLLWLFAALVFTVPALAQTGSIETVQFHSNLINATLPYTVVLPPDYRRSKTIRYPVLYLLHGWSGHYTDWITRTNVADYAAHYQMILVMPEGNNGWYTDSADVASDKYETYVLQELLPDVQKRYRTIESRYGRGIAGLSMGGFGALKFGLKSPGTFAFAGSISAALATSWTDDSLKRWPRTLQESVIKVFGPSGSPTRKANDIFELLRGQSPARVAALPYFYVDCGTEDLTLPDNVQLVELLREQKIPHEYRELPGDHSWQYWDQQVKEVLEIAAAKLRGARVSTKRAAGHR
jgi:S-formylglutathione hydrolase FrmB